MAGHTGEANEAGAYAKLVYLPCKPSNGFIPEPPKKHVDVIYLCSPNNPTGAAATREQLEAWVKYALEHKSVILFDAAYEAYITDPAHAAFDLRNSRRARVRDRIPQLLQERRLHRHALRVHRRSEIAQRADEDPASSSRCIRSGCGA